MSPLDDTLLELSRNPKQWEAFETEGHCAVLAPPGSGKTKLLTAKLAHELVNGGIAPPRGAACITMTNDAALELRRRLSILGVRPRPNLFIGTVHTFALSKIIGLFANPAGRHQLATSRFATKSEVTESFTKAFSHDGFSSSNSRDIRNAAEKVRKRLDYSGAPHLGGPRVAALVHRMQDDLDQQGIYDLTDLVRHAVDLVEQHEWVRRVLAATYGRVFVDEYQDLAPGLDRIVRAITLGTTSDSTLFAVGDPDQAIYAFSGAHPELLRHLATEIHSVTLEQNYRSGQGIIDVALRALGEIRSISANHAGGTVAAHPAPGGVVAQAEGVVRLVQAELAAGIAPEQIAVLTPWGSDRDLCVTYLRDAGVPAFARSDEHWKATPLTNLVESMAAWVMRGDPARTGLADLLSELQSALRGECDHACRRDVIQLLLKSDPSHPATEFVESLIQIALQPVVDSEETENAIELERMRSALAPGGSSDQTTVLTLGARARAPGHVLASTIHGAKGLEFDCVVLAGIDNAALPGFNPTEEEESEARRKFYVSITRARHRVHIVYTDKRIGKSGRPYQVRPSPFIADLGLC